MSEKITALPWKYDGHEYYTDFGGRFREIVGADEEEVIGEYAYLSDLDAAFIVRAVNSHHALVAALKQVRVELKPDGMQANWQILQALFTIDKALAEAEKP